MKEVLQCVSLESEQIAAFLTRFLPLFFFLPTLCLYLIIRCYVPLLVCRLWLPHYLHPFCSPHQMFVHPSMSLLSRGSDRSLSDICWPLPHYLFVPLRHPPNIHKQHSVALGWHSVVPRASSIVTLRCLGWLHKNTVSNGRPVTSSGEGRRNTNTTAHNQPACLHSCDCWL